MTGPLIGKDLLWHLRSIQQYHYDKKCDPNYKASVKRVLYVYDLKEQG